MALAYSDESTLLLPLIGGANEQPVWRTFLRNLVLRTGASRVCLLIRPQAAMPLAALQREAFASDLPERPALAVEPLVATGLLPLKTLRPDRVYALEEMFALADAGAAERQAALLAAQHIAHARFMRIAVRTDLDAWLILIHERKDFGAADSALLSALLPYLAVSIAVHADRQALLLRAAMAEEALALLGAGQVALDAEGRVLEADDLAAAELEAQVGARPALRPQAADALARACRDLAAADPRQRRILRHDERRARDLLLRPAQRDGTSIAAIGLIRQPRREDRVSGAQTLSATMGLSAREAALAEAISRGQSIIEAGATLQLTPETARNYSKRIYAKTGASGQADLVRMVLGGLAPFS